MGGYISNNSNNLLFLNEIILKYGGEEGIRTLESFLSPTPLAGERLRPLGHLSKNGQ